jgi:hypothetical protein
MNDTLDDVRRQIVDLRIKMALVEDQMRLHAAGKADFPDAASQLMGLRKELVQLIAKRNDLGGAEMLLPYKERFATAGRGDRTT